VDAVAIVADHRCTSTPVAHPLRRWGAGATPITIGIPAESLEAIASRATPVPGTDCSAGWAVSPFGSSATPEPARHRREGDEYHGNAWREGVYPLWSLRDADGLWGGLRVGIPAG
jgi:hypothetical protein